MRKPVLNETLYSLNVGDAARSGVQSLTPVEVVNVGSKYFYTRIIGKKGTRPDVQYHIDTWNEKTLHEKTDYAPTHSLYESEQCWRDELAAKYGW